MLTLEAINGGSGGAYFLNITDSSKPAVSPAERSFSANYSSRDLPCISRPTDQFIDAQNLVEIAFCKLGQQVSPQEKSILSFVQALKEDTLFPEEAKQVMGMLVYLGEKELDKVASLLDSSDTRGSILKVKAAFQEEIKELYGKVQQSVNDQYYADVFDYQQTERTKRVLLIANLLVTNDGWVNSALIPAIMEYCLNKQDPIQKEIISILDALHYACTNASSIHFNEHFSDVEAPQNQISEISDVIRATLQVCLNEKIETRHCKIAILVALLSHGNEKIPPSLFSREFLAERIDRFLIQLSYCIKYEKMKISEEEILVSWKLKQDLFDKQIKVRRSGTVSKVQRAYWGQSVVSWLYPAYELGKVPSFSQAYRMMGVGDELRADEWIIDTLFKQTITTSKILNVSDVLKEAATYSIRPATDADSITKNYRKGVLGFLSETSCPLLWVWRRLIRKAEKIQGCEARYQRIEQCIKSVFSHVVTDKSEEHRMREVYRLFFVHFSEQVKVYEGFNNLYDAKGSVIDSSSTFMAIIESSLSVAKEALLTTLFSETMKKGYSQLFDKLEQQVIDSHDFSFQFAVAYDPRNSVIKNSEDYLYNTPWNEFRDFAPQAFFTAFDDISAFKDQGIERPKSIGRFIESLVNRLRSASEESQHMQELHPSMKVLIDESKPAVDLLSERLIQPGLEISISEVNKDKQMEFLEIVKHKIVPSAQYQYFENKTSEIVKDSMILSMFFQNLLKVVLDCIELHEGDRQRGSLAFTNLVIESLLSKEQKKVIIESTIHLFPTNWSDEDGTSYYFVVFFNPITSNISLGTSNGQLIEELDQYDMVESGFLQSLLGH